jgi:hypothetical protein
MSEDSEGRSRGRPKIEFSAEQRLQISLMASINSPEEAIAMALNTSVDTLKRHCLMELEIGKWVRRGETVVKLHALAMEKGNVAALRELLALQQKAQADDIARGEHSPGPAHESPGATSRVRPGKKEIAEQLARSAGAGTSWGDDLDPGTRN